MQVATLTHVWGGSHGVQVATSLMSGEVVMVCK